MVRRRNGAGGDGWDYPCFGDSITEQGQSQASPGSGGATVREAQVVHRLLSCKLGHCLTEAGTGYCADEAACAVVFVGGRLSSSRRRSNYQTCRQNTSDEKGTLHLRPPKLSQSARLPSRQARYAEVSGVEKSAHTVKGP